MKCFARKDDKSKLKSLYNICFPGESGFCNSFFENVWRPEKTLLYKIDGEIAAMLQMLPCTMSDGEKEYSAYYIFAAATHPEYRSRGIMTELIQYSFEINQDKDLCVLIAAEETLKNYYARLGFKEGFYFDEINVKACASGIRYEKTSDFNAVNSIYEENMRGKIHNKRSIFDWRMNLLCSDAEIYIGSGSYIVAEKYNSKIYISEAVGDFAESLAAQFLYDFGVCDAVAVIPGKNRSLGMYRGIKCDEIPCGFINMMFN